MHPIWYNTFFVDAGYFLSSSGGRIGLTTKFPPQFGQISFNFVFTQFIQKVHSKLQIIAAFESGGRSLSQHSQFGFSFSTHIPFEQEA